MNQKTDAILFRRKLAEYHGYAFGLAQPVLLVELSTQTEGHKRLALVDAFVEKLSGEPIDATVIALDGCMGLLQRIHHGHASLLRSFNVPIFDECKLSTPRFNIETGMLDWQMALPTTNHRLSLQVVQWWVSAVNLLLREVADQDVNWKKNEQDWEQLQLLIRASALRSTNTIHFIRAAYQLGIPITKLGGDIYAFGTGCRARWFKSTITDATSALGSGIAKNKQATASLLKNFCLPAPDHALAVSEDSAVKIASVLGYPVVVKPVDQEQGRGVFAGLRSERSLRTAYQSSRRVSQNILVERHQDGEDYRLTVMKDKLIKVMHRQPAVVVGDGVSSVRQLVQVLLQSPEQKRAARRSGKPRIDLDDEALDLLRDQGLTPNDIPIAGQQIILRRKSNISAGGSHQLVPLDSVHPDNAALAVRTASLLGLDFAGIDLIMPDIAEPWHQCGAIIVEVNAQPQLGYRDMPDLYHRILLELVPKRGCIPLYLLEVDRNETPSVPQLQAWAQLRGCNAFSTPHGVWRDGRQLVWSPKNSFAAARAMLLDKQTSGALMVMAHDDIVRHGLPVADFERIASIGTEPQAREQGEQIMAKKAKVLVQTHLRSRAQQLARLATAQKVVGQTKKEIS